MAIELLIDGSSVEEHTRVARSGTSCQSFVLAMGALSGQRELDLLSSAVSNGATVEIRRNAAAALGQLCARSRASGNLSATWEQSAVAALSRGLEDRSVDNRGDVGSWVRKQSLQSLAGVFGSDCSVLQRLLSRDADLAVRLLGQVLHSMTEKIDKLRAAAGRLLELLLCEQRVDRDSDSDTDQALGSSLEQLRQLILIHSNHSRVEAEEGMNAQHLGQGCNSGGDKTSRLFAIVPALALGRDDADSITQNKCGFVKCSDFSWADPEAAFARIVPALSVSDKRLRRPLFEGLVLTGSTEPLGKFAVSAVAAYAETLPETGATVEDGAQSEWGVDGIVAELTRLLLTDRRTSKLINPALSVADQLVEQGALLAAAPVSWIPLYRATQRVAFKLRAPHRLELCLKLYSSLALMSEELAGLAVGSLLAHMAHPVLRIRQTAADHLFAVVCIHGAIDADSDSDDIGRILAETEWVQDSASVKDARARLTALVRRHLPQSQD
ncbi:hypothetical protein H4S02_004881 [Coemansia sp. RSA 2611]|nr:hypothetical protein H4S02_004881 [Coemansia sp. RSA 2611]